MAGTIVESERRGSTWGTGRGEERVIRGETGKEERPLKLPISLSVEKSFPTSLLESHCSVWSVVWALVGSSPSPATY